MEGFVEGFVLGCEEGIDVTEGAEDTEGCAEGSCEANAVEVWKDSTVAPRVALDTFDIKSFSTLVKFKPTQLSLHVVVFSRITLYSTEVACNFRLTATILLPLSVRLRPQSWIISTIGFSKPAFWKSVIIIA